MYYWEPAPEPQPGLEPEPETEEERRKRFDKNMEGALRAMFERDENLDKAIKHLSKALSGKDEYGSVDYNPEGPLGKIADHTGEIVSALNGGSGTSPFSGIENSLSSLQSSIDTISSKAAEVLEKTLGNAAHVAMQRENQRLTALLIALLRDKFDDDSDADIRKQLHAMALEVAPDSSKSPPGQSD